MSVAAARRTAVATLAGIVVTVALCGGALAPHDPVTPLGAPWSPPGDGSLLGTDVLGRDVLSRVLAGGRQLTLTAGAAAVVAAAVGITGGLLAGWRDGLLSRLLHAAADLLLAVPLLLIAMLFAFSLPATAAVIAATVCGGAPLTLRIVGDAVRQIRHAGYVDAALGRGESGTTILGREILPALAALAGTEIGARFLVALQLAAALSLLGLGPAPPAPDWAGMIRENVSGAGLSPAALVAPAVALAALSLTVAAAGGAAARHTRRPL
ncbi:MULTISPECIES: ABC transporter permease subunit [unclassified Micromonospora]|uniref:ABC transporter permease subunit n=1 Tax=unclassified Micromonospora TaxID=2617518 RepID=UPI003642D0FA